LSDRRVTIGFSTPPPALSADDAARILRDLWGIAGVATPLPSERDQNFQIESPTGLHVLKIANPSEDAEMLDAQNRAMLRIGEQLPDLVQTPVATLEGATLVTAVAGGEPRLVRLLTYLPGQPLARFEHQPGHLLRSVGAAVARVDVALENHDDPAFHREFYWDLSSAPTVVAENLAAVEAPGLHEHIARFLRRLREDVEPRLVDLGQSLIHNDPNDYNLLVSSGREVTGVLDLGDMVWSRTVHDPAIAAAYAIASGDDALHAVAEVAAGYHAVRPLTADELGVLYPLACLRLCQSACVAAVQAQREPENTYLGISQRRICRALPAALAVALPAAEAVLRAICGLPAVTGGAKVAEWFSEHACSIVSSAAEWGIRDRSPGSHETEPPAEWTAGRHNEPRVLTCPVSGDPTAVRPTVHLGTDVRMPVGTAIRAPLDGTVERYDRDTVVLAHETPHGRARTVIEGIACSAGDDVAAGHVIGTATRHLEIRLELVCGVPAMVAAPLRTAWAELSPDPSVLLGLPPGTLSANETPALETLARRQAVISPSVSISYREPLKIVRGEGAYLINDSGRRFLDCVNNVAHVGHSNPRVVAALTAQARVLNTNMRYLHDEIVRYAEALVARLPDRLSVCFFVNSGSEANDLALRIARTVTGRRRVLTLGGAYHGNSQSDIEVSPYKYRGPGGPGRADWVHELAMPDPYRGAHRGSTVESGAAYARELEEALATDAGNPRRLPAAFICEPILSCGGQIEPPPSFLARAFAAVRGAGGLCIADEVQIGFGRVGDAFWGFELHGVEPDVVTLGKPIGNGHPMAAVVTTPEIATAFDNGMEYFSTFGGNPVSAAVGIAVLEEIDARGLQENARSVGGRVLEGLGELAARHKVIGDYRGRGLFLGIELVRDRGTREPDPDTASEVVNRLRERGVLLSTDGPDHNVIKIKPPLVFGEREAGVLLERLGQVFAELE
jgi:4-aminobutyrate aminotransferase-like enzyme/Ser/Thr protein kinase RdoA (MazF antagonist)